MRPGTLLAILRTARPRQWFKNLFVAAPLVFARDLGDESTVLRAGLAFIIFCAISSAVYFGNDIADIEKDRAHPKKRNRPIPSGMLSIQAAKAVAAVLAVGGLVAAALLSVPFAACAFTYLVLNVAYSLRLKHVVYVDVLMLAVFFMLRTASGALAISVYASPYLFVCTGLLATFLGFGKRYHELEQGGAQAVTQRAALASYRTDVLIAAMWVTGAATLGAYFLYTRAPHTLAFFGTEKMVFTVPFVAFGLIRFVQLLRQGRGDSPTDEMLHDLPFMVNLAAFIATAIFVIY